MFSAFSNFTIMQLHVCPPYTQIGVWHQQCNYLRPRSSNRRIGRCHTGGLKSCPSEVSIIEAGINETKPIDRKRIKKMNSTRSLGTVEMFLREKRRQDRLKKIDATIGTQYYQRYMRKRNKQLETPSRRGKDHRRRKRNKFNCAIL